MRMQHREDMKVHDWRYTWAAKYNTTDTMLLVSGVLDEVDGMVAVFQVASSGDSGVFNVRISLRRKITASLHHIFVRATCHCTP